MKQTHDKVFFDSSVLIYALSRKDSRSRVAEDLLVLGGSISVQVLNEFVNVASRKLRLDWERIEAALAEIRFFLDEPLHLTTETHDQGIRIAKRYRYHIYDSLIIASALKVGAGVLYSEDMQHGQRIEKLTIVNPFRSI
jgi:predicted nucleic acid-binding protein